MTRFVLDLLGKLWDEEVKRFGYPRDRGGKSEMRVCEQGRASWYKAAGGEGQMDLTGRGTGGKRSPFFPLGRVPAMPGTYFHLHFSSIISWSCVSHWVTYCGWQPSAVTNTLLAPVIFLLLASALRLCCWPHHQGLVDLQLCWTLLCCNPGLPTQR